MAVAPCGADAIGAGDPREDLRAGRRNGAEVRGILRGPCGADATAIRGTIWPPGHAAGERFVDLVDLR